MPSSEFLKPIYSGQRFTDHSIPVELLQDLEGYETLIIEVAKWLYCKENNKQRAVKGFGKGVYIKLSEVEEGSAIPVLMLVANSFMASGVDTKPYYEAARVQVAKAIDAAQNKSSLRDILPKSSYRHFTKIGSRLLADESLDFAPRTSLNAKLNIESRIRLATEAPGIKTIEVTAKVKGGIVAVDKEQKYFTLLTKDRSHVTVKIDDSFSKTIMEAFDLTKDTPGVTVMGVGQLNAQQKMTTIDEVKSVVILDKLDVPTRLEEFIGYQTGWFNGEGEPFNESDISWLSDQFENNIDPDVLLPYTYPTPDREIQFEWHNNHHHSTLLFNLDSKSGYWHSLNTENDSDEELNFELKDDAGWKSLNDRLKQHYQQPQSE